MSGRDASTFHLEAMRRAGFGAWSWNKRTGEVYWSEVIYSIFDLTEEDFDGEFASYASLVHPDDLAHWQADVSRAIDSLESYETYHRIIHPRTGEEIWVHGFGDPILDEKGRPEGLMGIVHRVDKGAGMAKRHTAAHLQNLLDAYPYGAIHEIDHDLRFIHSGGAILNKYQLFPHLINGKTIFELFDEATIAEIEPHYRAALAGETTSWIMDFGDDHYEVVASPVTDTNGTVKSAVIISHVITREKELEDALNAHQLQRQQLSSIIDEVVVFHDTDHPEKVVWVGESAERILDVSPSDLLGTNLLKHIHEEDRDGFRSALLSSGLNGSEQDGIIVRFHGRSRCDWLSVRHLRLPNQKGGHLIASIFNPAEQLLRKEQLNRSLEIRLDALQQNPELGIWEMNLPTSDMTIEGPWPYMDFLQSRSGNTVLEQFENMLHPQSLTTFYRELEDILNGEKDVFEATFRLQPFHRNPKLWIKMTGTILQRDASGAPVSLFGVIQDVAESKSSLDDLLMFKAVVEQADEGVIVCSPNPVTYPGPRIVYVNDAQCRISGYSREELIGKTPRIFQGPNTSELVRQRMRSALEKGIPFNGSVSNQTKDGQEYQVELSISPLRNDAGELVAYVALQRDVTAEWNLKQKLIKSRQREYHLTEIKDTILSNMSHELKTPLAGILATAELLRDTATPEVRQWMDEMSQLAHRLDYSFSSILQLVDLDTDETDDSAERVDIVPDIRQLATRHFGSLSLDVEGRFSAEPNHIWCELNRERVTIVVDHLLKNAVKFTEKGYVDVSLTLNHDNLVILVSDSGIGMDTAFIQTATQPFTQESEGLSREFEGLGIGLAIAEGLTTSMRGSLHIQSEKGNGTTIKLTLPLFQRSKPARRRAPRSFGTAKSA